MAKSVYTAEIKKIGKKKTTSELLAKENIKEKVILSIKDLDSSHL